jgi:hypothetical protein
MAVRNVTFVSLLLAFAVSAFAFTNVLFSSVSIDSALDLAYRASGRIEQIAYRASGRLDQVAYRASGRLDQVAYRASGRLDQVAYRASGRFDVV